MKASSIFNWKNILILILIAILAVSLFFNTNYHKREEKRIITDTIVVIKEIKEIPPQPKDSIAVKYVIKELPIITQTPIVTDSSAITSDVLHGIDSTTVSVGPHEIDSVKVAIPISQKKYESEQYTAYVSGYCATLDSILIRNYVNTVKIRTPTKDKRFCIGLQVGYSVTPKGFQPSIGIGISYSLLKF